MSMSNLSSESLGRPGDVPGLAPSLVISARTVSGTHSSGSGIADLLIKPETLFPE